MKHKKVAIIQEIFIDFGGAERVLMSMLNIFPDADVYCPLITNKNLQKVKRATAGQVFTSWFSYLPVTGSSSAFLKPLFFLYWENLNLTSYDIVISLSHSFSAKSVITSPNTFHLSYIFTSPRYLYTEYHETKFIDNLFVKALTAPLKSWLRVQDFLGAQRPDLICADSILVQKRIQKYYRRGSKVLYPPVTFPSVTETEKFRKKKYYLCFSRLVKQKGTELAIEVANELKLPLLVVGRGSQETYLKSIAGPTINFLGFVEDKEMPKVFSQAVAFINCAKEEDFGLVNVEALHFGVPVIGYNSGAISEIVQDGKTGVLFTEYTTAALKQAITRFQQRNFSSSVIVRSANRFSEQIFQKKVKALLSEAET